MSRTLRLGCLISGTGRTMVNLAERIESGRLPATISLVLSSCPSAGGLELARQRGLDGCVVLRRDHASESDMHDAITAALVACSVDLVCLCGYLRWFRVDEPFRERAINIHPALLPDFGGRGMYGTAVHSAVLASGATESGCTVHFVDDHYDHGPVILQRRCPVLPGDDEHSLAARVFEAECETYPEAIRLFAEGRLRLPESGA